jgi:hypothetical protein
VPSRRPRRLIHAGPLIERGTRLGHKKAVLASGDSEGGGGGSGRGGGSFAAGGAQRAQLFNAL